MSDVSFFSFSITSSPGFAFGISICSRGNAEIRGWPTSEEIAREAPKRGRRMSGRLITGSRKVRKDRKEIDDQNFQRLSFSGSQHSLDVLSSTSDL